MLSDVNRQFHLEEIDKNTWKFYEVKSENNIVLQTLHRDAKNGY